MDLRTGSFLLFYGLFQKTVVADNLAQLADAGFADSSSGPQALIAVYAFAFQIFADFDGYTNMARGMALLMGFRLFHNFHAPYFASSPATFGIAGISPSPLGSATIYTYLLEATVAALSEPA